MRSRIQYGICCASFALLGGCARTPLVVEALPPSHTTVVTEVLRVDGAPREEARLVPAEVYVRTYLALFGSLAPLEVQRRARGGDGVQLFDTWNDYLGALGFPDYRLDLPRARETNALMVAAFERLGVALCDRALEHDWRGRAWSAPPTGAMGNALLAGSLAASGPPPPTPPVEKAQPPPLAERTLFAFAPPPQKGPVDDAAFAAGFDVLHRTFLGYPAQLAPPDRAARFRRLFDETARRHEEAKGLVDGKRSRFTANEAAWAAVCYGLVRHPEFHLY